MLTLSGEQIFLRAMEPEDLEFLYELENNEAVWEVSNTITPYSKFVLKQYLENSYKDIYEAKQLRLAITGSGNEIYGLVDIYDFDPKNKRAGVGVIIIDAQHRNKGIATEALQLVISYAFTHLELHQLYANVSEDNSASIKLFSNLAFEQTGIKKDWNLVSG
ncbi:MAG: GNAT family N-acetyltransferase, partial [Bacteroidota bacterium]